MHTHTHTHTHHLKLQLFLNFECKDFGIWQWSNVVFGKALTRTLCQFFTRYLFVVERTHTHTHTPFVVTQQHTNVFTNVVVPSHSRSPVRQGGAAPGVMWCNKNELVGRSCLNCFKLDYSLIIKVLTYWGGNLGNYSNLNCWSLVGGKVNVVFSFSLICFS